MSIYSIPQKYARLLLEYKSIKFEREYAAEIMSKNNILNKDVEGEGLFLEKWQKFNIKTSPIFYRCFSKYVGYNPDIMPGDICKNIIEPIMNPVRYRDYYADKNVFEKLYPKELMPKTILRRMNGIFMDGDYNVIRVTKNNVLDFLYDADQFILKPSVDSCSGRGVSLFQKDHDVYVNQNGNVFNFDYLVSNYGDNFIIQEYIEQSDYLAQFNPSSINTIRLTVYRSVIDNQLYVTNGILRIGAVNSVVDNAHAGGVFCGINKEGRLSNYVGTSEGRIFDTFNGINFKESSYEIPNFNAITTFALNIAKEILHHRIIALDIALDKKNTPVFIEHNIGAYGYWVFQIAGQITLDGFTDEIIDYCSQVNDYNLTGINL